MTLAGVLAGRGAPLLCGHRGAAATHPENTLPAIEAALAAGCDAVEVDVHVTADSRLAVIHDATLERTTDGWGAVAGRSAAELGMLDAGGWFACAFAGTALPMLEEVLETCRGRALVLVEVKAEFSRWPAAARLVGEAARRCGAVDDALLLAFDHRHLEAGRRLAPDLERVALCDAAPADPAALLAALDAAALGPCHDAVDAGVCERVHAAGGLVVTWTVDAEAEAARLQAAGVDAVIGDDPARLLPVLHPERRASGGEAHLG